MNWLFRFAPSRVFFLVLCCFFVQRLLAKYECVLNAFIPCQKTVESINIIFASLDSVVGESLARGSSCSGARERLSPLACFSPAPAPQRASSLFFTAAPSGLFVVGEAASFDSARGVRDGSSCVLCRCFAAAFPRLFSRLSFRAEIICCWLEQNGQRGVWGYFLL